MSGQADHAAARRIADQTLAALDFRRRDLIIYVPGTDEHAVNGTFAGAVGAEWSQRDVSMAALPYEASYRLRASVSTGIEALRLVLDAISRRGGTHRVFLTGWSQGGWVIGETLTDPRLRRVVTRAAFGGHPGVANTHYEDGRDPSVLEINHDGDGVAATPTGGRDQAIDAITLARSTGIRTFGDVGTVLGAALANLAPLAMIAMSLLRINFPVLQLVSTEPHLYEPEMARVATFLRTGRDPGPPPPAR